MSADAWSCLADPRAAPLKEWVTRPATKPDVQCRKSRRRIGLGPKGLRQLRGRTCHV